MCTTVVSECRKVEEQLNSKLLNHVFEQENLESYSQKRSKDEGKRFLIDTYTRAV